GYLTAAERHANVEVEALALDDAGRLALVRRGGQLQVRDAATGAPRLEHQGALTGEWLVPGAAAGVFRGRPDLAGGGRGAAARGGRGRAARGRRLGRGLGRGAAPPERAHVAGRAGGGQPGRPAGRLARHGLEANQPAARGERLGGGHGPAPELVPARRGPAL